MYVDEAAVVAEFKIRMTTKSLVLKRASASRSSGQWSDDDYDVLENGVVVGRIFLLGVVAPRGRPWMWASGHSAATIKRAAHGYEPTREAAMAAFAKSWRKGQGVHSQIAPPLRTGRCPIPATNRETLARLLPQTTKPKPLRAKYA
jgi:hypothetical protein